MKQLKTLKSWIKAYRHPLKIDKLQRFNFFPLSHEPVIIFTYTGWDLSNVFFMSQELAQSGAVFVVGFTRYPRLWHLRYMKRQLQLYQRTYPENKIIFLANSEEELENMLQLDFPAYHVANNAFQREDLFEVKHGAEKIHDAVMNARLARWKRLELAREIHNLALITIKDDEEYYCEMKHVLSHAKWMNFDANGDYRYLPRTKISDIVNSSKVGVILSSFEGNNRASIEYLLCGIPVVSTPSKGGRDVFFDDEYCLLVDPDPTAVSEGVAELAGRNVDPEYIRRNTLIKIKEHRSRLLGILSELVHEDVGIDLNKWTERFPDNLEFRGEPQHFLKFLRSDYLRSTPPHKSERKLKEVDYNQWEAIVK